MVVLSKTRVAKCVSAQTARSFPAYASSSSSGARAARQLGSSCQIAVSGRVRFYILILCLGWAFTLTPSAAQGQSDFRFTGHFKYRLSGFNNPGNSVFRESAGDTTMDHGADTRLNLLWRDGVWSARTDYQLIWLKGDAFATARDVPEERLFLAGQVPTDRARLFDLTDVITQGENYALVQRLDRLWFGYSGENTTTRIGRQTLTWGNGLFYTPMDFFNPFDPSAVDKEYKPGDDMLYGQYARHNGDDVQGVLVFRRDLMTDEVAADKSSLAFKYHGFNERSELDLLAARHFDNTLGGIGGNKELGDGVWRGDVVVTDTEEDLVLQLVTSFTRSWYSLGKNISGAVEYFYNGFGQSNGNYSPQALAMNPDLVRRIARGELFTLGRHYLAASASIEVTPLWLLTPNLFVNLSDGSALIQGVVQHDLRQDIVLLGAVNIPIGADGTEFGGIPSEEPGKFLSSGLGIFLQLAAYF